MSATVSTPVIAVEVVEKKVRVPTTLPAKYGKFIQFGYYLMNKLNACDGDEDTPPLIDEQVFLNKMRIFEPLEDQQAFVEEFLESSKQINDELRKMMLQRKRDIAKAAKEADKPKKEKKPRQPKQKKSEESADPAVVPVEKKSKAKKVKVTSTEDALVNELVQLAEGSASEEPKVSSLSKKESAEGTNGLASLIPLPPPSKKESAKAAVAKLIAEVPKIADPVKETKPKVVKETKPKEEKPKVEKPKVAKETKPKEEKPKSGEPTVPPETPSLPVKETKPKAVKETKPKAVKETKPTVVEEKPKAAKETTPVAEEITNDKEGVSGGVAELDIGSPEEEELQVSIFMYEGQQYLIDDLNNVYDFTSQDKIGSLVDQILVKSGEP